MAILQPTELGTLRKKKQQWSALEGFEGYQYLLYTFRR
jgi:hypothetical protein